MMKDSSTKWFDQLIVAVLFLALTIVALYFFVKAAEPRERKPGVKFTQTYNEAKLVSQLDQAHLQATMAEIQAASKDPITGNVSRVTGSPGFYNTEKLIEQHMKQAGIEPVTQEYDVVVPVTEYCEVLDENGKPLPGVKLLPFEPSGLTPVALPPQGLTGDLQVIESTQPLDMVGREIENSIVLVNGLRNPCAWSNLASMGAKAVIVKEDPNAPQPNPDLPSNWSSMTTPFEIPYPRFWASGPIEKYAGKALKLRCKVTWQTKRARNIIGVLKCEKPSREALVLTSYYDDYSIIPDMAPGGEQAISLAALLDMMTAMKPYQDSMKRDVVFVATAGHTQALTGVTQLLRAIEKFHGRVKNYITDEERLADTNNKLEYIKTAREILDSPDAWKSTENSAYRQVWLSKYTDPEFRKWFEECFSTVAGEIDLERKDETLKARLGWIHDGRPTFRAGFDVEHATINERKKPENLATSSIIFQEARKVEMRSSTQVSTPFWMVNFQLTQSSPEGTDAFKDWGYLPKLRAYIDRLQQYHETQKQSLEDNAKIRKLFNDNYDQTFTVNLDLNSGGSLQSLDLAVLTGVGMISTNVEPQCSELRNALLENVPLVNGERAYRISSWGARDSAGAQKEKLSIASGYTEYESEVWVGMQRLAFSITTRNFTPARVTTPADTFEGLNLTAVGQQLPIIGRALLAIGHGKIGFKEFPFRDIGGGLRRIHGTVFTRAGLSTSVPSHPQGDNTFVQIYQDKPKTFNVQGGLTHGVKIYSILQANPYGEYDKPLNYDLITWFPMAIVDAARFDENGQVKYFANASPASQSIFKSENTLVADLKLGKEKPVNVAVFRCTQVACYQRINPKTLNAFASFDFLNYPGLTGFDNQNVENHIESPASYAFLDPDAVFGIALLDGSAANPEIQTYRAFMLNVDPKEPIAKGETDLYGHGYLAADYPNLTFSYFDAAATMLRTNEKRLALQNRYRMSDEQMNDSQKFGMQMLDEARKYRDKGDSVMAMNMAGRSLAYAVNNHPVIRTKISNAVLGILWYLALLVPFVFFFEKLLFGFTDIRKQLLANGVIFVIVFLLLRSFHPAFQMVRSSEMILLGFLILLLAVLVTVMVSTKFQQTVKVLRQKEGHVEGADVNRGGVVGTAFMLGLNNMRRRKVRTGLTCITLVLITFVMICFTSVTTSLQDIEYMTGRSPSNGLYRRDLNFAALTDNEVNNIKQIYGLKYPVAVTYWLTGALNIWAPLKNPEVMIFRSYLAGKNTVDKNAKANSAMFMAWNEPEFSRIDRYLLTHRGWFPRPPETPEEIQRAQEQKIVMPNYVIIPDAVADALNLTVEAVDTGHEMVTIRGEQYEVMGIFDSEKLNKHVGMDGQSILPYDLNSIQALGRSTKGAGTNYVVPATIGRLKSSQVIIVSKLITPDAATELNFPVSCSVLFPDKPYRLRSDQPMQEAVSYKQQRALVQEYLERVGIDAYYARGNIAYYGSRTRTKSIAGLIELLIPLLIAAMTVFNTMRGSVYERKEEIYVYNAVGIAPNHVFFMFIAEACVYAVIGAMGGYLLSQIVGTVLVQAFPGFTSGLNMDYSSIETIYASVAIVASVLISTIVPARTASKLALPSDETSWTMPKTDGDFMRFNLPFTFSAHDRVAIISYFYRWLDANGEGSSGSFFCAPPKPALGYDEEETRSGGLVPCIETTVWLKPYDLGVSQQVTISLPTDPETGEYIASITIERLSGTMSAWNRAVKPFLGALRKQFLNWRAVSDAERREMFEEAKTLISDTTSTTRETVNV